MMPWCCGGTWHSLMLSLPSMVHPRLGPIDSAAVLDCVEQTLQAAHQAYATAWKEAGTLQLVRDAPKLTKVGKLMPLHHLK